MTYQVLARKWRPGSFAELVGQEHVQRALINALDNNRLHHAFLFTGTRGVGKTTIARILAKSLNCETGVTSTPCGQCGTCREISEGRFVDLIEVDAASRTKVEDTRELLENVQYAPSRGRYKVYLIDEVHMLSTHSFNALLKTLEEPPPHVKFLLATTDPQKLPVTILSRCLQFNLKRLPVEQISTYLGQVLGKEGIAAEPTGLTRLARAADGSMRDALSLLDQAIAFGGGALNDADVAAMLGTIEHTYIADLLRALATGNAGDAVDCMARLAEQAPDFPGVLGELLRTLHHIALVQVVPGALSADMGDPDALRELTEILAPEDVQLYYQIGLLARRDLSLAPDPRSGFEMAVLRMLAFRPTDVPTPSPKPVTSTAQVRVTSAPTPTLAPTPAPVSAPIMTPPSTGTPTAPYDANQWATLVGRLALTGITQQLAINCALVAQTDTEVRLSLSPANRQLLSKARQDALQHALQQALGTQAKLVITLTDDSADATPATLQKERQTQRRQDAISSLEGDSAVQAMKDIFGATLNRDSIQPTD